MYYLLDPLLKSGFFFLYYKLKVNKVAKIKLLVFFLNLTGL